MSMSLILLHQDTISTAVLSGNNNTECPEYHGYNIWHVINYILFLFHGNREMRVVILLGLRAQWSNFDVNTRVN